MKRRSILALALSLALAASLASGCSSQPAGSAAAGETKAAAATAAGTEAGAAASSDATAADADDGYKSIVISIDKDAPSLGPLNGTGPGVDYTRNQAFETLCFINVDKQLEMCIAREVQDKGSGVYDIVLYDNVKDIDGNPLKASDVVYCFDNAIKSGFYSSNFSTVQKYEAKDDTTVEITFSNERIGQLESILCNVAMYTKIAYDASPDQMAQKPVGTKPYKLTEAISGSHYVYEKTDSYWQTDASKICTASKSNVDKVTFTVITDETTAAIALQNGEIDKPSGVSAVDYANFVDGDWKALPGYTALVADSSKVFHVVYNCSDKSPCADVNLRKAIAYAIDAQALATNVRGAMAYTVGGGITNRIWLDGDGTKDASAYYQYNRDTAKELLAKSGYSGQALKLVVQNSSVHPTIGTLIQAYCADIGVKVDVSVVEPAVYNTLKKDVSGTQFDLFLGYEGARAYYAWSANFELDVNSYDKQNNLLGIHDEKLQQLYDAAAGKSTASAENTKALLDYSEEMCYIYGLYANRNLVVARDKVSSIVLNWDNNFIPGACTVVADDKYGK